MLITSNKKLTSQHTRGGGGGTEDEQKGINSPLLWAQAKVLHRSADLYYYYKVAVILF